MDKKTKKLYRVTCTMEYDCAFEVEAENEKMAYAIAYGRMNEDDYDEREFGGTSNWQTTEIEEGAETLSRAGFEKWWGGDAEYDLAGDLEEFYEYTTGFSAVLWTPQNAERHTVPSDALGYRPEEFITHGYTCEYEDWGQRKVAEAVRNGCQDADEVYEYITKQK